MTALYRAALGPVNADRYLPRFTHFDTLGRTRPGWNWAACACTLNWMALRYLWSAALVYVAAVEGLGLLVFGVGRTLLQWPDAVQWGLIAVFAALAFVLPGVYGDAVLHTEIRKRITRALGATRTIPEACSQLGRQASSWRRLIALALLNLALLGLASAAYWVLPEGSLTRASGSSEITQPITEPPAAAASLPEPAAAPASAPMPASMPAPAPQPPAVPASAPANRASAPQFPTDPIPAALPQEGSSPPAPAARPPEKPATAPPPPATAGTPVDRPAAASAAIEASGALPAEVGKAPGYYINVGLFAEEANARKAQALLLNEGLPAFRQPLDTARGKRIRVRVGPYPSATEAHTAARQIRSLKLEAVVFRQ